MPPKSNIFFIKSYLNGLCLDVEGGSRDEGAKVIMYEQKPVEEADNQLWYHDMHTDTIRNVQTDYCLEADDSHGWVSRYNRGSSQQWTISGQFISEEGSRSCLDVAGNNEEEGADVCCWPRHGNVNQRWYIEYVPRKYFYIVSLKNEEKVLDISGADDSEGAELIIYQKNEDQPDNQLWYQSRDGVIRSKLNNFTFDSSECYIKMRPLNIRSRGQGFQFNNKTVYNVHDSNKVLDIEGNSDDDGAKVLEYDYHGNENQQWRLHYV